MDDIEPQMMALKRQMDSLTVEIHILEQQMRSDHADIIKLLEEILHTSTETEVNRKASQRMAIDTARSIIGNVISS